VPDFDSLIIEPDGPVLTVRVKPLRVTLARDDPPDIHRDLGLFLDGLRHDYSVRVVVLTGAEDGEFICSPPSATGGKRLPSTHRAVDPRKQWSLFQGLVHTHETMAELEIPIVAKVNGHAVGFGQSVMFACDLIVAREDAVVTDMHMSMGTTLPSGAAAGLDWGTVPGDGAGALIPLYMAPPLAKEYLMLGRQLTAKDLAEARLINRAVPADELDAAVDGLVGELLARPPFALGWTKRIVNSHVKARLNNSLDAGAALEMVNFLHQAGEGAPGAWEPPSAE